MVTNREQNADLAPGFLLFRLRFLDENQVLRCSGRDDKKIKTLVSWIAEGLFVLHFSPLSTGLTS